VKARVADLILFQTYGEIDPSEDPVLVLPCCSMVYTMATLDGTLQMRQFYDDNGKPRGALPGGYVDIPQCPNCKKPIRGLRRYGRVTKRAAIDAAEKKFIAHAQTRLVALQDRVHAALEHGHLSGDKTLRDSLRAFGSMVKRPPCKKVFEACVAALTKAEGGEGGDVDIDYSALPVPNSSFRFFGYYNLFSAQLRLLRSGAATAKAEKYAREDVDQFTSGSYSQQACEARLVLVQALLTRADQLVRESVETADERTKHETAAERITTKAENILERLKASPSFLLGHAEEVQLLRRKMVRIAQEARRITFYQTVSIKELRAIKTAMQEGFSGSGHWYRCVNGHSYAIGECGTAVEQTRCPECGAPVGGANFTFVEGTVYDERMESL
jgi:hypothetical protein